MDVNSNISLHKEERVRDKNLLKFYLGIKILKQKLKSNIYKGKILEKMT